MTVQFDQLETCIKDLATKNTQFFMYVDPKYVKSHGILKISERRYNVLTQHVTIELARKAGPVSVLNVFNKMHMKVAFAEGLNYRPIVDAAAYVSFLAFFHNNSFKFRLQRLDISKGKILVIGLDSSMPPKATPNELFKLREKKLEVVSYEPTIIGVCFLRTHNRNFKFKSIKIAGNYQTEPNSFLGTYFYQPAKQDAINVDLLKNYTEWMLKKNKRAAPTLVVVL
jgi:hypothetical protein